MLSRLHFFCQGYICVRTSSLKKSLWKNLVLSIWLLLHYLAKGRNSRTLLFQLCLFNRLLHLKKKPIGFFSLLPKWKKSCILVNAQIKVKCKRAVKGNILQCVLKLQIKLKSRTNLVTGVNIWRCSNEYAVFTNKLLLIFLKCFLLYALLKLWTMRLF